MPSALDAINNANDALRAPEPEAPPEKDASDSRASNALRNAQQALAPMAPIIGTAAVAPAAPAVPTEEASALRNFATGLMRAPGTIAAIPNNLASLWHNFVNPQPGLATTVLNSTNEPILGLKFPTEDYYTKNTTIPAYNMATGGDFKPYQPQTPFGEFTQNVIATAPLAAYGPMGVTGSAVKTAAEAAPGLLSKVLQYARSVPLASREAENVFGNAGVEVAKVASPNDPGAQAVAGLLAGGALTPAVGKPLSYGANLAGQLYGSENKVQRTAQNRVNYGEPSIMPGQKVINQLADTALTGLGGAAVGYAANKLIPGIGLLPYAELLPLAGGIFGGVTGYKNHIPYSVATRVEKFQNRVNDAVDALAAERSAASTMTDPSLQWINRTPGVNAGQPTMSGNVLQPGFYAPPAAWTMPSYVPKSWTQYFLDRTNYLYDRAAGLGAPQTQVR